MEAIDEIIQYNIIAKITNPNYINEGMNNSLMFLPYPLENQ